jgi:hypothetical protein
MIRLRELNKIKNHNNSQTTRKQAKTGEGQFGY